MTRYITKQFEVDAVRFVGSIDNSLELSKFTEGNFHLVDNDITRDAEVYDYLHDTWVGVTKGQWIIRGMKGEFYPCDDEVFTSKYEEA